MSKNPRIERQIIIGMIVSTEYLKQIRPLWSSRLLKSAMAKRLAKWCMDYYDQYNSAPGKMMEILYLEKLKADKLPKEIAEEIEEDILPDLSEEYERDQFNVQYLLDQTELYFQERGLEEYQTQLKALLDTGDVEGAKKMASEYNPPSRKVRDDLDLSSEEDLMPVIEEAFQEQEKPLFNYPGAFGEFMNEHLIRGGFISLLAPEKRGKTFFLIDMANRASSQGCKVAFFQAGDMTRNQQIRRLAIYRAKKSDKEKYCGKRLIPVKDCIHNQLDRCDKDQRECDYGIFDGNELSKFEEGLRKEIDFNTLREKLEEYPDYKNCHNCLEYRENPWGTVWLKEVDTGNPLNVEEAKKMMKRFFIDKKRRFKLSTHANGTLSVKEMNSIMNEWEKNDGFVPDVIIIDYADLLIYPEKDFRHQQNEIWKALRGLSQKRHSLVITVTQADAKSYDQDSLKLSNYSEDKRKYAHVTAMWGMNQDPKGREKKMGLMRFNELVIREGEFDAGRQIHVLQSLSQGQAFLTSYW